MNYVGFWDAARFANWMHNGQPTGAQGSATTEHVAYTLDGHTGDDGSWIARNPGAIWFIPTEDEWYKAAYHKNDGVTSNYWDYPTGADATASNDLIDPDPGNNANFYYQGGYTIGSPYYRTEFGEFENSESPYDTFDQGGNVWEWNEVLIPGSNRGIRGGSFNAGYPYLDAAYRIDTSYPTNENRTLGFRLACVPEPGTKTLLALGSLGIVRRRKQ